MKKADPTVPSAKDFNKRRSVEAGLKLADAAHVATWRLYCEVLALWRGCRNKKCRRHRRCLGEAAACLLRAQPSVPEARLSEAAKEVMAGGPRRGRPEPGRRADRETCRCGRRPRRRLRCRCPWCGCG